MLTKSKMCIHKPKLFSPVVNLSMIEPCSVKQALSNDLWKASMKQEYDALINNNT